MARATTNRSRIALPILVICVAVAGVLAVLLGTTTLSPQAILSGAALAPGSVIRELRIPRVLLAFGVGGTLAVAGAALQALLRNPLAEPWLLGLSGGASLGAVIAVVIGLPFGWSIGGCATI
ncbi:MAG: iron chelate uptake ABC transporter family permease subunit, partial [Gemmatimonadota bacterium]